MPELSFAHLAQAAVQFKRIGQREKIRDDLIEARTVAHKQGDSKSLLKISKALADIGYDRESEQTGLALQALQLTGDVKTALYRHYDKDNRLLYIGISLSVLHRLSDHRASSDWADEIAIVKVKYFPSRNLALVAEKTAIQKEKPYHNKIHRNYGLLECLRS